MKLLVGTSLLFLTNCIHNAWHREFVYAWLFLLLTTTSVFVHSTIFKDESLHFLSVLDKTVIVSIFFYGVYIYWKTGTSIYPILSVMATAFIYLGIFQEEQENVITTHAIMHIIGSLGHHFIIHDYGYSLDIQESIQNLVKSRYLSLMQEFHRHIHID
jgi:hypothetical protein